MGITKELLAAYRSKRQEIKELDYILNNRWKSESMISADTILNYSKGYPVPEGVAGFDQERYERLQNRDIRRKERLEEECKAVEDFVSGIQDSVTRRIFQMYYLDGLNPVKQENVAKKLHMERSNVSKKIDKYLQVSHNSHESHL